MNRFNVQAIDLLNKFRRIISGAEKQICTDKIKLDEIQEEIIDLKKHLDSEQVKFDKLINTPKKTPKLHQNLSNLKESIASLNDEFTERTKENQMLEIRISLTSKLIENLNSLIELQSSSISGSRNKLEPSDLFETDIIKLHSDLLEMNLQLKDTKVELDVFKSFLTNCNENFNEIVKIKMLNQGKSFDDLSKENEYLKGLTEKLIGDLEKLTGELKKYSQKEKINRWIFRYVFNQIKKKSTPRTEIISLVSRLKP